MINGVVASGVLALLVYVGSRRLIYFDAVLMPYLFATLFAVLGIVYRYTVWLDRPPTRMLWRRSLNFVFSKKFIILSWWVLKTFFRQIVLQRFIEKRSHYRWLMHFLIAWGTLVSFAITFPLVFGWLHFETAVGSNELYQLYVFGFPSLIFKHDGVIGFLFYNTLNISALAVLIGVVMAFARRLLHPGLMAVQTFANDMLPLLILFFVSVTGLFLTYSAHFLEGEHFRVFSTLHCFAVVIFLVYLPFGKFFHIFQRAAQLGVTIYIEEKKNGIKAHCPNCKEPFTSRMQQKDIKEVLTDLGFQYQKEEGGYAVQDLCPFCRRRMFMLGQHKKLNGNFDIHK